MSDDDRGAPATPPIDHLDNALTGALPCVTCRYDLKGLSIRSLCPECGTAVRATILYQVDPMADAFQPIRHPRVLAWGLVLWSASALVSALAVWGLRSADLIATQTFSSPHVPWLASLALWGVLLSWVGSLTMIRPLPSMNRWHSIGALLASLAYLPLIWAMGRMLLEIDPTRPPPYFSVEPGADRVGLRLVASGSMIASILLIRPVARDLVKRSLVLRTGRVDRQTLLVMAVVLGVSMLGDLLRLAAADAQWIDPVPWATIGTLLVVLSSGLFTLGLLGATVDGWRIRRAILIPAPSMTQVLGEEGAKRLSGSFHVP